MIRTGKRVIVLASSLKGGIGPRRGSIGYASASPALKSKYYNDELGCFAQPIQITFMRYGFEKTQRKETKYFINVVPFDTHQFENIERPVELDTIDCLIDKVGKINSEGYFWDSVKNRVTSVFGRKSVHIGIVVPIPNQRNLINMGNEEFETWAETFLTNHEFHQLVCAMCKEPNRLGGAVNQVALTHMRDTLVDKNTRRAYLSIGRKHIIDTITRVTAIGTSRPYIKIGQANKHWLENTNMSKNRSTLIGGVQILLENFYSDKSFTMKVKSINNVQNSRAKLATQYMVDLRKRLLCLAQALERQA